MNYNTKVILILLLLSFIIKINRDMSLSFAEIKELIKEKKFNVFRRKPEILEQYKKDSIKDKAIYNTTRDMILINYLKYTPYCGFDGKIRATIKSHPKNKYHAMDINMVPNKYPYNVQDDVMHMVIWAAEEVDMKYIDELLKQCLPNNEVVYFTNPQSLKSIPSVFHVQVFIKI